MKKTLKTAVICLSMAMLLTACAGKSTASVPAGALGETVTESASVEESLATDAEETTVREEVTKGEDTANVEPLPGSEGVDVDLTVMSSTIVYSTVYNMMVEPDQYKGKVIKMEGIFDVYTDETTGKTYYSCIIQDATQCCAQGIEFTLADGRSYPDEYPAVGSIITVEGVFETYEENGYYYCNLADAVML